MRKIWGITSVALCLWSCLAIVAVQPASAEDRNVGIGLDMAYVSKYMWRGYDVYDDHGAFQPSITFDLFQTGLSANVWASYALESSFEELDEIDYTIAYERSFFEDELYALDFGINYIFYDFPNANSDLSDSQEVGMSFALTGLPEIGPSPIVPSYYVAYLWAMSSGGPEDGYYHIFGLSYDLPVPALIPDQEEQCLAFSADLTYNDGAFGVDSDFTHATIGVGTDFEYQGFTLSPFLNYQFSFEDAVNDEDDFYAGFTVSYAFSIGGDA